MDRWILKSFMKQSRLNREIVGNRNMNSFPGPILIYFFTWMQTKYQTNLTMRNDKGTIEENEDEVYLFSLTVSKNIALQRMMYIYLRYCWYCCD